MKKKRRQAFTLFKSIFLRYRSLNNAKWFYGEKRKIWKVNLYYTETRLRRNEMCYAVDNHNMCYICTKGFLNSNFNKAVIDKISFFS